MATQEYINTIIMVLKYGDKSIVKNTTQSLNRMKLEIINDIEYHLLDVALTISNIQIYNECEIRKIEQNEMSLRIGMIMFLNEYKNCFNQRIHLIKLSKMNSKFFI